MIFLVLCNRTIKISIYSVSSFQLQVFLILFLNIIIYYLRLPKEFIDILHPTSKKLLKTMMRLIQRKNAKLSHHFRL